MNNYDLAVDINTEDLRGGLMECRVYLLETLRIAYALGQIHVRTDIPICDFTRVIYFNEGDLKELNKLSVKEQALHIRKLLFGEACSLSIFLIDSKVIPLGVDTDGKYIGFKGDKYENGGYKYEFIEYSGDLVNELEDMKIDPAYLEKCRIYMKNLNLKMSMVEGDPCYYFNGRIYNGKKSIKSIYKSCLCKETVKNADGLSNIKVAHRVGFDGLTSDEMLNMYYMMLVEIEKCNIKFNCIMNFEGGIVSSNIYVNNMAEVFKCKEIVSSKLNVNNLAGDMNVEYIDASEISIDSVTENGGFYNETLILSKLNIGDCKELNCVLREVSNSEVRCDACNNFYISEEFRKSRVYIKEANQVLIDDYITRGHNEVYIGKAKEVKIGKIESGAELIVYFEDKLCLNSIMDILKDKNHGVKIVVSRELDSLLKKTWRGLLGRKMNYEVIGSNIGKLVEHRKEK